MILAVGTGAPHGSHPTNERIDARIARLMLISLSAVSLRLLGTLTDMALL